MNDRLEKRYNFIINHSKLFIKYWKIKGYPQSSNPIVKKIALLARNEICYSDKTVSCDIAWTLGMFYKDIVNVIII